MPWVEDRPYGSIPAWAGKPPVLDCEFGAVRVHPRVGGETRSSPKTTTRMAGPSPRGRGNRERRDCSGNSRRSIPAWAGKPTSHGSRVSPKRVHPRVGGETHVRDLPSVGIHGPSPRGRGNRDPRQPQLRGEGSIPAWAGKPTELLATYGSVEVHPRVGGETRAPVRTKPSASGPSPRGRGNRPQTPWRRSLAWSIPAWAGKPSRRQCRPHWSWVHPRVGGETPIDGDTATETYGPSPRGRGNRERTGRSAGTRWSIPAWAGKPCCSCCCLAVKAVHPRVGGETVCDGVTRLCHCGPSPRGRGNRAPLGSDIATRGSIPAWAGKPPPSRSTAGSRRVHPRVGGETWPWCARYRAAKGPSPRGRGNRSEPDTADRLVGSIPAWAGKPAGTMSRSARPGVHPRVGGETTHNLGNVQEYTGPSPRGRGNRRQSGRHAGKRGSIPAWAGKPCGLF